MHNNEEEKVNSVKVTSRATKVKEIIKTRDEKLVTITFKLPEDRAIVEEYVNAHKNKNNKDAAGSFNEYLMAKYKDDPRYADKLIIAVISGVAERYDSTVGGKNKNGVELEGGDFSGSTFKDVNISASLKGCRFNDCKFQNVTFTKANLEAVDFRGVSLKNINFADYDDFIYQANWGEGSRDLKEVLGNVCFAYNDVTAVQKLGVFRMEDKVAVKHALRAEKETIEQRYEEEKQDLEAELGATRGFTGFIFGESALNAETKKRVQEVRAKIGSLEKEKEQDIEKAKDRIRSEHIIEFHKSRTDATYRPMNQDDSYRNLEIITKPAGVADLKRFLDQSQIKSFAEFMFQDEMASGQKQRFIVNMQGVDISGMNMGGRDYSEVNFAGVTAKDTVFCGCTLKGTCFEKAELSGASFENCEVEGANFIGSTAVESHMNIKNAVFLYSSFQKSNLQIEAEDTYIIASDMTGAKLSGHVGGNKSEEIPGLEVDRSDLENVNLKALHGAYLRLRDSVLREAIMEECQITNVDLQNVDATGAQIINSDIQDLNIQGELEEERQKLIDEAVDGIRNGSSDLEAELEKIAKILRESSKLAAANNLTIAKTKLEKLYVEHASLAGAKFQDVVIGKMDARGIVADGMVWDSVTAKKAEIKESTMQQFKAAQSNLEGATIEAVDLALANLTGANLRSALLEAVSLREANMNGAKLDDANLAQVNIEGASLVAASMERAKVSDVKFDDDTNLAFANLKGLQGKDSDKLLKKHKDDIHKLNQELGWFHSSRFGIPTNGMDARARYKAQELGALVLASAGAGGGYLFGGPLAGLTAGAVTGLFSKTGLEALIAYQKSMIREDLKKQGLDDIAINKILDDQYQSLNNQIGDILAAVGVIAQSSGVKAIDNAIDGAAIGLVFASMSKIPEILAIGGGAVAAVAGTKLAQSNMAKENKLIKGIGVGAAVAGGGAAILGLISTISSSQQVVQGAAIGGAIGGLRGAAWAVK